MYAFLADFMGVFGKQLNVGKKSANISAFIKLFCPSIRKAYLVFIDISDVINCM